MCHIFKTFYNGKHVSVHGTAHPTGAKLQLDMEETRM